MPTDDILWKKIDSLVSQQTENADAFVPAPQPSSEDVPTFPHSQRQLAGKRASNRASREAGPAPSHNQSLHASMRAGASLAYPPEWVEATRKLIKTTGKEVAYTRLTAQEKKRLSDVVYSFRRQGIRTSENEVLRIAINHLLEDFSASGNGSFLRRVIAALLA